MTTRNRKKNKVWQKPLAAGGVELNVMPFVDIFSLLCTFLLFSAVFVSIGIQEVQIPFLSNASSSSKGESKRELSLKLDLSVDELELVSAYTLEPVNQDIKKFPRTKEGLQELHRILVELKEANPEAEKIDFFVDDDVTYEGIVEVLDEVKLRKGGDPGGASQDGKNNAFLFPKVIMGNVLL